MPDTISNSLNDQLLPLLKEERFALLLTIDKESGAPRADAISWVYAPDSKRIFLAIDNRSTIVDNIRANEQAALMIFGAGSVYEARGEAAIAEEMMEGVPIKLARIVLSIRQARDAMFYGSKISMEPQYEKTYDPKAASQLDHQVMTALKNA